MEKDCGVWISILFHKLRKRINADVQSLGLTGIQSRVIHYILEKHAHGPVYQRDVEGAFGVSRSTVTGMLQQMERDGLIHREMYPEIPPKVEYTLTERGRSLMRVLDQLCTWGLENRP